MTQFLMINPDFTNFVLYSIGFLLNAYYISRKEG